MDRFAEIFVRNYEHDRGIFVNMFLKISCNIFARFGIRVVLTLSNNLGSVPSLFSERVSVRLALLIFQI